jgi:uncharacterized protein
MIKENFALVTGASRGIGRAIAEELARRGYNLVLHSLQGEGLAEACTLLEKKYNITVKYKEADLSADLSPKDLFDFVCNEGIKISILVNNAGIGYEGPVEAYPEKQVNLMILLNIRALTLLTSYFTPMLKSSGKAYILNVGSFGTYTPTAYKSIYLATKSYIYYFSRAVGAEFKGSGVKTCVLMPSAVITNPAVVDRIERGGWFARKSALTPEQAAAYGVRALFKGRSAYVPGKISRLFFALGVLVPEGIIILITRKIFSNYKVLS